MKKYLTKFFVVLMLAVGMSVGTGVADANSNWWQYYYPWGTQYQQTTPVAQTTLAPQVAATGSEYSASITAEEQLMVNLVNEERTARGLQPLQVDMRIVKTARVKASDLIANDYFEHNSPVLGSPFDQMRAAGIQYRYAGENLAGSSGVERAHQALMNSPGHRANILHKNYTHIGIGAIRGGRYGMMFVQHFIQK